MKIIISILILSLSALSFADGGFVEKRKGHSLFVNWAKAQPDQPTVVLLNGLTYSTKQWDDFAEALEKRGFGVVRYDMYGMGETLLKYAPILAEISYKDQVTDLYQLLEKLNIPKPYNLVGLSYGGGIAAAFTEAYPHLIKNAVLMAPFTAKVKQQDEWIRQQIAMNREMFPLNPASDDELYDYFLKQLIYTTYPSAEPSSLDNPYKLEGIFRMVQGIRKWNAEDLTGRYPAHAVHLVIADQDQYIQRSVLDHFWSKVPAQAKGSLIVIEKSEHKIPEAYPHFSAAWIAEILTGKNIQTGDNYKGNPTTGDVHGNNKFNIGKE